ncbi:MAG: LamG domain-containing protein [Phycisphaerae bacterium]|nr:LamG domain-containing protein [Phycisphaerae bacterium]
MRRIGLLVFALLVCWCGSARADLVGYWPLDGDAADASGNGNDGTILNNVTPTADRFGNPAGAMSFGGGANDKIDLGDKPEFRITGAMTLSAWVLLRGGNPNNGRIVAKGGGGGQRSWGLNTELLSGGVSNPATFQIASNSNTNVSVLDTQPLPTDEWVHVAGVFRPGEAMEVYVNGELRNRNTTNIPAQQHSDNTLPVVIGTRHAASNCGWYGAIDEVRIYNEALSQAEISNIMRTLSAGNPDPASGADRVSVNALLSWDAPGPEWLSDPNAADEVQYVVYFDPNELLVAERDASVRFGPQYETEFAPAATLEMATKYYWRVDVIDPNFGGPITYPGLVWSFTTLPPKAGLLFPADGAVSVAKNAVLQWDAGYGAAEHDVYFGTDAALVGSADASVYVGRTSETSLDADLDWQTQYFWRIDEIFPGDVVEQGDVWSFTTGTAVCEYVLPGDLNGDCAIDFQDVALMAANWMVCNLTNGDCP